MGQGDLPRINEVAAFLAEFAPEERDRILVTSPDLEPLLQLGVFGGEEAAPRSAISSGLSARAAVLAVALAAGMQKCAAALVRINGKLKRARRFRFISSALGAVGASSVIGAAFVGRVETIIAGALTLASTLASMFANSVILGREGREDELVTIARRLMKAAATAELTRALLEALPDTDFEAAEMRELIERGNALFEEMNDALAAERN